MDSYRKKRWITKLAIQGANKLIPIKEEREENGCTIEYTEIKIETFGEFFSFGFEAFSRENKEGNILKTVIDQLGIILDSLRAHSPCSYTELLKGLKHE